MKTLDNKKGLSVLAALLTIMSLAALGGVMAYTVAGGYEGQANQVISTQAFYVTQAGLEYGIKHMVDGLSSDVTNFSFGPGQFTTSFSGNTLTATGVVANASRQHKVDNPTQDNCLGIDVDNTHLTLGDKRLMLITFRKKCLSQIVVDKMKYTWLPNNGEKLKEIKIENNIVYTNGTGVASGTNIDISPNPTLSNGANNVINWIQFSADISSKTFTYDWTLGDNSHATGTFQTED